MLLYKKYFLALSQITNSDAELLKHFEDTFRFAISSLDMQILMDGIIPPKILLNVLQNSLKSTSQLAFEKSTTSHNSNFLHMSFQIWNPLLEVTIRDCKTLLSASRLENTPSKQPSKNKVGSIAAAFEDLKIDEVQSNQIRILLKEHGASTKRPFAGKFHKHIQCSKDNCNFCKTLYHSVNITKCVGHKPCHRSGYYPHIGHPLWCMLKNKHNKEICNLTPKTCKPGELPSLSKDIHDGVQLREFIVNTPSESWADEVSNQSGSTLCDPLPVEKEPIFYPTVKKRKNNNTECS